MESPIGNTARKLHHPERSSLRNIKAKVAGSSSIAGDPVELAQVGLILRPSNELSSKRPSEFFLSRFFSWRVTVHLLQSDPDLFLKIFSGIPRVAFRREDSFGKPPCRFSGSGSERFFEKKTQRKMPASGFLLSSLRQLPRCQHRPCLAARSLFVAILPIPSLLVPTLQFTSNQVLGRVTVAQESSLANRSVSTSDAPPSQQTPETRRQTTQVDGRGDV